MTDFNGRSEDAVRIRQEAEGEPLDKTVERANKALANKEWPTAALLLQMVSLKAMHLGAFALQQEVNLMKGAMDGPQEG